LEFDIEPRERAKSLKEALSEFAVTRGASAFS